MGFIAPIGVGIVVLLACAFKTRGKKQEEKLVTVPPKLEPVPGIPIVIQSKSPTLSAIKPAPDVSYEVTKLVEKIATKPAPLPTTTISPYREPSPIDWNTAVPLEQGIKGPMRYLNQNLLPPVTGSVPKVANITTKEDALRYAIKGFHAIVAAYLNLPSNRPIEYFARAAEEYFLVADAIRNKVGNLKSWTDGLKIANSLSDKAYAGV